MPWINSFISITYCTSKVKFYALNSRVIMIRVLVHLPDAQPYNTITKHFFRKIKVQWLDFGSHNVPFRDPPFPKCPISPTLANPKARNIMS